MSEQLMNLWCLAGRCRSESLPRWISDCVSSTSNKHLGCCAVLRSRRQNHETTAAEVHSVHSGSYSLAVHSCDSFPPVFGGVFLFSLSKNRDCRQKGLGKIDK